VFYLLAQVNEEASLKNPKDWLPNSLFGKDTTALRKRLELIAGVPEMKLDERRDSEGVPIRSRRDVARVLGQAENRSRMTILDSHNAFLYDKKRCRIAIHKRAAERS
jgi:hypothetical protein